MKKIIIFILSLVLAISLCACGEASSKETVTESASKQENTISTIGEYEKYNVEIKDAAFTEIDGESCIRVNFTYTNNDTEPLYLYESFSIKAYQNDTEIENITDINNGEETELNVIKGVKNGKSIECSMVFKTTADSSVEVRVCTPTADEVLLAAKLFEAN